jgi:hypothetical protein
MCWRHPKASARWPFQTPIPLPSYQRTLATALHLDALTLITCVPLLTLCRLANDNERTVQASETLRELASIRLLLRRKHPLRHVARA